MVQRRRSSAAATAGLVALPVALLIGGALLLVLGTDDLGSGALLIGTVAISGLVLPPVVAGSFARAFGWDPAARRRQLIGIAVLTLLQAAAGLLLLALTSSAGLDTGAALLLVFAALALDLVLPLLGSGARQPVQRVPHRGLEAAAASVRRRMVVGAVIGGALGLLLLVLLVLDDPVGRLGASALFLPAFASLGASLVSLPAHLRASQTVRDLTGDRYSSATRIGRAIRGQAVDLSPEEADRASRWAAVGPSWLRLQVIRQSVGLVTSASILTALALDQPELGWLLPALGIGIVVLAAILAISVPRSARRFRAYAAAHPPADAP